MLIRFSQLSEFVEELERDKLIVSRSIVRICFRYTRSGPFTVLSVLGTAIVGLEVIHCEQKIGDYLSAETDGVPVNGRGESVLNHFKDLLAVRGFEVRNGVFEIGRDVLTRSAS